jgi:alpha-tubulin suppressor-like RCC1 family protein
MEPPCKVLRSRDGIVMRFFCCATIVLGCASCGPSSSEDSIALLALPLSPSAAFTSAMPQMVTGSAHTCSLDRSGSVFCWGRGREGAIGRDGGDTCGWQDDKCSRSPRKVPLPGPVSQIAAAGAHTCAITSGKVYCWGYNETGQLGNGKTDDTSAPQLVSEISGATRIATGPFHTCAIVEGARVFCWGHNGSSQLGGPPGQPFEQSCLARYRPNDGRPIYRRCFIHPVEVTGLGSAVQLALSSTTTCALQAEGTVRCLGGSEAGQLGDGSAFSELSDRPTPGPVSGLENVVAIVAGHTHFCAQQQQGTVQCWGANESGQLGRGVPNKRWFSTPGVFRGITNATQIASGGNVACAVVSGRPQCWGIGTAGQFGVFATGPLGPPPYGLCNPNWCAWAPSLVPGIDQVETITTGGSHVCALRTDGSSWCWGDAYFGELGRGALVLDTTLKSFTPAPVVPAR